MQARTVANGMRPSTPKMQSHTVSCPPIAFAMVTCPHDPHILARTLLEHLIAMREHKQHGLTW